MSRLPISKPLVSEGKPQAHGATCVADVRSVPRSRHNPRFSHACLIS
ncbi:MAG: DUF488 family protein [Limisphaerales bacterium]